ncbi:glycoside hydrolase family 1 protein [Moniliophthora roreri]|nr:glycoside hydrolase family 1 protein [Moniliophthora roreri]
MQTQLPGFFPLLLCLSCALAGVSSDSPLPFTGTSFPAIGTIERNYSPENLDKLWDVVGTVTAPPFTTTPIPEVPVQLPSPPPPLYPSWFAPEPKGILPDLKFPKDFIFGVDTAAFQVEGAVKDEGKGPTMWDWATHQPGFVVDNTTGDITDLQYFLYKEDTARVAALGVNAHSFSISWARIFPFGTADSPVNQQGLAHYSDLHWDMPLALQAYYGGFTSGSIVADFVNYAKTVFRAYNGRVKTWYTFNEPRVFCGQIASFPFNVTFPAGVNNSNAPYHCSYNLLKAHAGAVKAFREMNITGEIAFKNDDYVGTPWRTNSTEDTEAVERHAAFQIGIFSDPVYRTGDWPKILTDTLPESYLPRFTEEEKQDIHGSADFFAIDSYRSQLIAAPDEGIEACVSDPANPLWPTCNVVKEFDSAGWAVGISSDPRTPWLQATPNALRAYLGELQRRWPTKKMYVAEFGFAEPFEGIREPQELYRVTEDVARTNYYMTYLGEILLAIHEDKLPIAGIFAWAMIDNMEWSSGLSTR